MTIIVPKLTDNRTLAEIRAQLVEDIRVLDNQIFGEELDLIEQESELISDLSKMCRQLGMIKEITSLKWAVDCDCFYTYNNHQ